MLLALDTSGETGGVALGPILDDRSAGEELVQVAGVRELQGRKFSELLLAAVAAVLDEAKMDVTQLSGIVVDHGPGSFTGLRIGISAAKGLAEALSIPLIAISRLSLLAGETPNAIAVLDAGRGEFYTGVYRSGVRESEGVLTREELLRMVADSGMTVVVCEEEVSSALAEVAPTLVGAPTASAALRAGARRFVRKDFDEVATLEPNYLRRSDMEILARLAQHAAAASPTFSTVAFSRD